MDGMEDGWMGCVCINSQKYLTIFTIIDQSKSPIPFTALKQPHSKRRRMFRARAYLRLPAAFSLSSIFKEKEEDGKRKTNNAPGIGGTGSGEKQVLHQQQPVQASSPQHLSQTKPSSDNSHQHYEGLSLLTPTKDAVKSEWNNNWDFLSPVDVARMEPEWATATEEERHKIVETHTPKAVRNIILVRHGQYHTEAKEREERKLTPLGREQAALLGKRLAVTAPLLNLDKCTFSTMIRARETGRIAVKEMNQFAEEQCQLDTMLEEGPPCVPDPAVSRYRPSISSFYKHSARIESAFRKYFHRARPKQSQDSFELIVCHANVIRYFVCRALQFPPEGWLRISLANTSITWLQIHPDGRVVLKSLGDFGHLPPEKTSFA